MVERWVRMFRGDFCIWGRSKVIGWGKGEQTCCFGRSSFVDVVDNLDLSGAYDTVAPFNSSDLVCPRPG